MVPIVKCTVKYNNNVLLLQDPYIKGIGKIYNNVYKHHVTPIDFLLTFTNFCYSPFTGTFNIPNNVVSEYKFG